MSFVRAEQRVLHKHTVLWQSDVVVVHMAMVRDPDVFDELLYRVLSLIIVHVGHKEAPPRLAAVARLARALRSLESGKQLTLGGCRVRTSFIVVAVEVIVAIVPSAEYYRVSTESGTCDQLNGYIHWFCRSADG